MHDVFLSYARPTAKQARQVAQALRGLGYSVWLDDELPAHRAYTRVIEEQLDSAKATLVIWSADAVKSQWVLSEANRARDLDKLVQLTIDGARLPMPFEQIQCADLTSWTGEPTDHGWRKVVASIAELVGREAPAGAPGDGHPQIAAKRRQVRRPPWIWAAAALVALSLAGAATWIARERFQAGEEIADTRVAVLPFDAVGRDPAAQLFAGTLPDRIVSALTTEQVVTIARGDGALLAGPQADAQAARLGVGLTLGGVVEGDGKTLKVQVHLDDPRQHLTLWSKAFEGGVADVEGLQARIAVRATAICKWALSPQLKAVAGDRSIVAAYLEARDELRNEGGGRSVEIARDIVAKAPRFAGGHELLADALIGETTPATPASDETSAVAQAIRESKAALDLDRATGTPYAELAREAPLWAWSDREHLLEQGLAADPNNPDLGEGKATYLLWNVGRLREAIEWTRRNIRAAPLNVGETETLALLLAWVGQKEEAQKTIAQARRLSPDYWEIPLSDFEVACTTGDWTRALALLDDPGLRQILGSGPAGGAAVIEVYRSVLRAAASGDAGRIRAAALTIAKAADAGTIEPRAAVGWLSGLGDVDGAFRVADRAFTPANLSHAAGLSFGNSGGVVILFAPGTAAMRRDPRFMPLAARLRLVDYWRSSGHWPDFCAEPGLPHDCKVEAARLAKSPA